MGGGVRGTELPWWYVGLSSRRVEGARKETLEDRGSLVTKSHDYMIYVHAVVARGT